jgi:hypothetical protein
MVNWDVDGVKGRIVLSLLDRLDKGSFKNNRVDIGVVWLCRIMTYEDYFKLGFMTRI